MEISIEIHDWVEVPGGGAEHTVIDTVPFPYGYRPQQNDQILPPIVPRPSTVRFTRFGVDSISIVVDVNED